MDIHKYVTKYHNNIQFYYDIILEHEQLGATILQQIRIS